MDGKEYFHVSCEHAYNKFSRLETGSTVLCGLRSNSFFSFYEDELLIPISGPNGTDHLKAMHYLNNVRLGNINPDYSTYPTYAYHIAQHYMMLARELVMEEVRQKLRPEAPSRMSCLWIVETIEEGRYWQRRLDSPSRILVLQIDGIIHNADASLLLADSEPLSSTYERAQKYWRGELSDKPEREILFAGTALVASITT